MKKKIVILAASLFFIVVGVLLVLNSGNKNTTFYVPRVPKDKIIVSYPSHTHIGYVEVPGEWRYSDAVESALKEYQGQDVLYLLGCSFYFLEVDSPDLSSEESIKDFKEQGIVYTKEEVERLSALGYHVGYAETWEYTGLRDNEVEKSPRYPIAGYFTEKQLENFPAREDCFYIFYFLSIGSGEPVDPMLGIHLDMNQWNGTINNP